MTEKQPQKTIAAALLDAQKDRAALAKRKNKVIELVSGVSKTGHNKTQNYDFVTDADVLRSIRKAMNEVGIAFTAETDGMTITHEIPTKYSANMQHIVVDMILTLTDTDTGYYEPHKWMGAAADSGDKSLYKAYTSGIKYFLMKTFLLPTGDDVEGDESVDKAASKPAPKQKPRPAYLPKPEPKDAVEWQQFVMAVEAGAKDADIKLDAKKLPNWLFKQYHGKIKLPVKPSDIDGILSELIKIKHGMEDK